MIAEIAWLIEKEYKKGGLNIKISADKIRMSELIFNFFRIRINSNSDNKPSSIGINLDVNSKLFLNKKDKITIIKGNPKE